jgi:hypothetical protein
MLFNSPRFSDVQIQIIEGNNVDSVHAHKAILANVSKYFDQEFYNFDGTVIQVYERVDPAKRLLEWMYKPGPFLPRGTEELAERWKIKF